jgi:cysteine sulfinate desulfinase/cysteine desulfurase-like protein
VQSATNIPLDRLADTFSPTGGEGWDKENGYRVTDPLPVDDDGLLKLADLENAFTGDTALVSLMWANNAAIQAALHANPGKRHIVTPAVEHSCPSGWQ